VRTLIQKIAGGGLPLSSLRWRLTLWTVLISVGVQAGLAGMLVWYQHGVLDRAAAQRLERRARLVAQELTGLEAPADNAALARIVDRVVVHLLHEEFAVALFDGRGRRVAWAGGGTGPDVITPDLISRRHTAHRERMPGVLLDGGQDPADRVMIQPAPVDGAGAGWVMIAASDAQFEEQWGLLVSVVATALSIAALSTALACWFISGIAIPPLLDLKRITSSMLPETIRRDDPGEPEPPTDLRGVQNDLINVRARLRESFRAQDRLIAHLSHELKTPIAVVLVEASTLSPGSLSSEARGFVRSVRQEMRRLARLLESFMIISRAQSGQRAPADHVCDLGVLAYDAALACAEPASARGVTVSIRLEPEAADLSAPGDADMLRLLIQHLLGAAIAASPAGKTVEIRVSAGPTTRSVTVTDQGEPIPEDKMSGVFDWFTEAQPQREKRHSPDLALARAIAELHGGRISVRNGAQGGCVFAAELPQHAEPLASGPA
jgi:signal transduction histidine kinase